MLSQGAGSHRCFLLPPCCPQLGLVASPLWGTRGDPLLAALVQPVGRGRRGHPAVPCARQEIGASSAVCGTAGPSQRGLEGTMWLRGQPAASEGRILLLTAVGGLQAPASRTLRPTANPHRERMLRVPQGGTGSPRRPSKHRNHQWDPWEWAAPLNVSSGSLLPPSPVPPAQPWGGRGSPAPRPQPLGKAF